MSGLAIARPEAIGLDSTRLDRAFATLKKWTDEDKVPAAALCVGRHGRIVEPRFFGKPRLEAKAPAIKDDALFLVASITKPITVMAAMMLVERGELALDDRVVSILPAFKGKDRQGVLVRHLMTHTSGLPDMLPENETLRKAHKPLSAFIDAACLTPLLFPPGTKVSYQSMGTLLLSEIVHQISGKSIQEFLKKEIFDPLGLVDTSLGWQPAKKDRIATVRLDAAMMKTNWSNNSPYWLALGAPWGGLITPPAELAKICQLLLNGGELDGVRLLGPATVRAMTMNQLAAMPGVPEEDRRCRPWGLGWRLNWPAHSASFGDLLGPRTYGHWGATGTVCWIDPDASAFCILLTTQPQEPEGRFLARICNIVASSII